MSRKAENKSGNGNKVTKAEDPVEVAQKKLDEAAKGLEIAKASNSLEDIRKATVAHAECLVKSLKAQHAGKEEVKTAVLALRALLHPNEVKQAPEVPKQASLRGDLIPLSSIPDHWLVAAVMLQEKLAKDLEGPVSALHATMTLLKELYLLNEPHWQQVRDRVSIGLIKDTKNHGNTSVSMGAAKTAPEFARCVGFLNCGTGGVKYQMYSNEGCLHLEAEAKPKGGASPNALKVGSYSPANAVSFEATRGLLEEELKNAPWKDLQDVPVYAFVTGTIRQAWEDAEESEKAVLDAEMERLFEGLGIKPLGDSFFMSQDDEGKFELLGTQAMYANLVEAGSLDEGTKVVASFGIGRGSCQWMVQEASGQLDLIPHRAGMTKPLEMMKVSGTVLGAYRDAARLKALVEALSSCTRPVIALKSGCALLMEMKEYPQIKQQLVAPVPPPGELIQLQIQRNNERGQPVKLSWHRGSFDRLCAEAGVALGAADLVRAFHQDGVAVTNPAAVQSGESLIFTNWTEPFAPRKQFQPVVDEDARRLQEWAKLGRPLEGAPASEAPGFVVTGGLAWAEQTVNEKAAKQYDETAAAIAKLGGDAVYVYPRYALHTTVATLGSFKGTSPLRVASPEELSVVREGWCRVLTSAFDPLLEAGPITLVADKLQLSEGAGIIVFSDPQNRFAEFRAKMKEALQTLLQDASILALRAEVRDAIRDAFTIPNIVHSTFARFAQKDLEGGNWEQFEARFGELSRGWTAVPVVLEELRLAGEPVPFMHSTQPFADDKQQHRFWLTKARSSDGGGSRSVGEEKQARSARGESSSSNSSSVRSGDSGSKQSEKDTREVKPTESGVKKEGEQEHQTRSVEKSAPPPEQHEFKVSNASSQENLKVSGRETPIPFALAMGFAVTFGLATLWKLWAKRQKIGH